MKLFKSITFCLTLLLCLSSCQDFEALEKDPNRPTAVPASLVFNGIINDAFNAYNRPWGDVSRWNQFNAVNYNYYGNNEYAWTSAGLNYFTLKNIVKMEEEAAKAYGKDKVNPYGALGKFLKAYFFYQMTMRVGDLPMMEALKGLENTVPKYDTQQDILKSALDMLEASNTELTELIGAGDASLAGDIYFSNDLRAWQKVVNTFKLRVLIQLSKKEIEFSAKQKFAEVISNPTKYPIMTSMANNWQYVYNATLNKYPVNPDNFGFDATRYNMAATHIGLLTSLKDPRVFYVGEPAQKKIDGGASPTSFDAFVGAPSGEDLADMSTKALAGEYSFYGRYRYYRTYTAEPTIIIGYPELCFNIAEAIHIGWVTGSAEDFYKKGIQASQGTFGIKDGANDVKFFKKNIIDLINPTTKEVNYDTYSVNFIFNDYYNQTAVKYAGAGTTGLNQILTQKYLAFFMNSGWEAYYNYRRTGVPTFSVGVGTGNSGRIPKRFQYPQAERTTNATNYNEALQRQFGGTTDDINSDIFIIK
ncbi:MAG: SusD/RagB family nutrient-binding outer membrane lipoprotein [Verrucomicrobia bacterium]|nr:SusD/RagB family nutrient-binding outer membrane lipoprotein [Cytophagales bacterium]